MKIKSNWTITLDPGGSSERVLLAAGGFMDDEIELPWSQITQESPRPGATNRRNFGRKNVSTPLGFKVYNTHSDDATAREWMLELAVWLTSNAAGQTLTARIDIASGSSYLLSEVVAADAVPKMHARPSSTAETLTSWRLLGAGWSVIDDMVTEGGEELFTEGAELLLT